jgi:hypothetical protein
MSTCSVPQNQSIYQALIDKAASYPADKPYQAKAYKKAAESVAAYNLNLYNISEIYPDKLSGIGHTIEGFIYDFIDANPEPKPALTRSIACGGNLQYCGHPECSDNTKTTDEPTKTVTSSQENPMIASNYLNDAWHVEYMKKWRAEQAAERAEYLKTPVYTAENPRRSKRVAKMPQKKYFTEEDEQDEIAEVIEAVCAKKGYEFSEDLVTEFNNWLPTASNIYKIKYDWKNDKSIPKSNPEIAKEWTMYYSKSLLEQKKQQKLDKAIIKYCEKNGFEYQDVMTEKFAAWKADPANKKLITTTYNLYEGCLCNSCDTKKPNATEYCYERSPAYCVKAWFSTLKKTIVF